MEFVLNRNYVLRSTTGHIINFEKNVPVHVPPMLHADVRAIGAETVDGSVVNVLPDDPVAKVIPQGIERNDAITTAMIMLRDENARNDFTAQGLPQVKSIEKLVGFDIDKEERDTLWTRLQTGE
jgi:hypothetical protein